MRPVPYVSRSVRALAGLLCLVALRAGAEPGNENRERLGSFLAASGLPDFYSEGTSRCFFFIRGLDENAELEWHRFPLNGPLTVTSDGPVSFSLVGGGSKLPIRELLQACGSTVSALFHIVQKTCGKESLFRAWLKEVTSLRYRQPQLPPTLAAVARAHDSPWSYFIATENVGCATRTLSSGGEVAAWVIRHERVDDAGDRAPRGRAFLQWKRGNEVAAAEAPDDLHLDTIIDQIEFLPGTSDSVLVLGLRSYFDIFVGDLPRRFAQVIQLPMGPGRALAVRKGSFEVGGVIRDRLLLRAPVPESGKFRHSRLAHQWLRFHAAEGELKLETLPYEPQAASISIGYWKAGTFAVSGLPWREISVARKWGTSD